ncbi:MAG TPA: Gfo/Idh/MocA family oxidoreductase [Pirellulaceae bacterium]|nr:Gfo/Idh/MocA family oxidoreductase [Pirellulaceae bacterium]
MDRRSFLEASAAATAFASLTSAARAQNRSPSDKISICMMGVRGRGAGVLATFAGLPEVEVRYVCDLDEQVRESRLAQVEQKTGKKPIGLKDFRQALEDKTLDALVLGTPDHWHALPTIYACQAGKDVYVEKPDGHNILEGRTMVAAAKKYGRVVQLGTQSRSGQHFFSCMDYLKTGALGKVRFAKAWESAKQGSLGKPADSDPPAGFDYDTWLGPAPKKPFNRMRFHGNWRWFFDLGTGDLGNDGVHRLDYCRWALASAAAAQKETLPDLPRAVSALGGKYYFDDIQEWPDTLMVTYDFAPNYLMTYEMRVWNSYPLHEESEGAAVCGDNGFVVIGNTRWRAFDAKGKQIKEEKGDYNNDVAHAKNFLDCMRSRGKPNADLETIGHPSSLLCHIGNAAWRAGRTLRFDPATYTFAGDADANQYLTRAEYRKPWVLPKLSEL